MMKIWNLWYSMDKSKGSGMNFSGIFFQTFFKWCVAEICPSEDQTYLTKKNKTWTTFTKNKGAGIHYSSLPETALGERPFQPTFADWKVQATSSISSLKKNATNTSTLPYHLPFLPKLLRMPTKADRRWRKNVDCSNSSWFYAEFTFSRALP